MKDNKEITRREAISRLTKIIALAAGLSTAQVRRVLGLQTSAATPKQAAALKAAKLQNVKNVRAQNINVKILKVMLHNNRAVFESEFGRVTPAYKITNMKAIPQNYQRFLEGIQPGLIGNGSFICPIHAGGPGGGDLAQCGAGLVCGEHFFEGLGGVISGECNHCKKDGCSGHLLCVPPYSCEQVSCGTKLTYNVPVTEGFINQYINDTYIQALFRELHAPTSQALAQELQNMLNNVK